VLYTTDALLAELRELKVIRAGQVRRVVHTADGDATALDTLVVCRQDGTTGR